MVIKMSKGKLYKIDKNMNFKSDTTTFIVSLVIYAIVLMLANSLFKNIYVENFLYALVAALILGALNYTIKPILIYWTLPLSVVTFGIAYPLVNMIILKICDILMGSAFEISGFFSTFIIAIFISGMKMFLDSFITKNIGGK